MEFNQVLKERIMKLRTELPEAAITYVDVYAAKYGLISNAKKEGNLVSFFLTSNVFGLCYFRYSRYADHYKGLPNPIDAWSFDALYASNDCCTGVVHCQSHFNSGF